MGNTWILLKHNEGREIWGRGLERADVCRDRDGHAKCVVRYISQLWAEPLSNDAAILAAKGK